MSSVRLLFNSLLLVVKFLGNQKLHTDFWLCKGFMPLILMLYKGQLHIFNFTNEFYIFICFYVVTHSLSVRFKLKNSLNICYKAGLVDMKSLSFWFSGNVFISPLFPKDSFAGYSILAWLLFFLLAPWKYHPTHFLFIVSLTPSTKCDT